MKKNLNTILLLIVICLLCAGFVYMKCVEKRIPTIYYLKDSGLINIDSNNLNNNEDEEKTGIYFNIYSSDKKQKNLEYADEVHLRCYDKESKYLTTIIASCNKNDYTLNCKDNKGFDINTGSKSSSVFYSSSAFPENFVENFGYCELIGVFN